QDCGQRLDPAPTGPRKPPSGAQPAVDGPICPACGAVNPPGMNFCKMCGTGLVRAPVPAVAPVSAKVACGSCGKMTPSGFAFCQPAPTQPEGLRVTAPVPGKTDPGMSIHGRLVIVKRDGSDGDEHPLVGDSFDVGRSEGGLTFNDDPYLAARHARFSFDDGTV